MFPIYFKNKLFSIGDIQTYLVRSENSRKFLKLCMKLVHDIFSK